MDGKTYLWMDIRSYGQTAIYNMEASMYKNIKMKLAALDEFPLHVP
jgi:hypothetical protein